MLRAYRRTFMGAISERWRNLIDLQPVLRVPVIVLTGALLCFGFFPQPLVRIVAPTLRSYLSADRSCLISKSRSTATVHHAAELTQADAPQQRSDDIP
jgi:NADH:ubiquinone oxidoreductase subunit 4 (subunit M)